MSFFLGIFFNKAQRNSQTLKNISNVSKAYDKIEQEKDMRSNTDVLKKR